MVNVITIIEYSGSYSNVTFELVIRCEGVCSSCENFSRRGRLPAGRMICCGVVAGRVWGNNFVGSVVVWWPCLQLRVVIGPRDGGLVCALGWTLVLLPGLRTVIPYT
jgi:hypothetical protein